MLNVTSEHSMRVLTCLARLPKGTFALGRDIATQADVPAKYLSKIMVVLRDGGFVVTARGAGGGYALCRPADAIHLIDVVSLFDIGSAKRPCFLGVNKQCDDANPCSAHQSWSSLSRTYVEFLERTTLADIAREPLHATQMTPSYRREKKIAVAAV